MRQKFKISPARILGIIGLIMFLLMVRVLQRHLFYDPLLPFFKSSKTELPVYDTARLFLGLAFRYMLNSLISLGILWLAFKDIQVVKLSAILMLIFFALLAPALLIILNSSEPSLLAIFYIRRFLIQPLFLILFLPAFYYQKHMR
jgi:exosortase F-associated protein